jgi:hypothetical protein
MEYCAICRKNFPQGRRKTHILSNQHVLLNKYHKDKNVGLLELWHHEHDKIKDMPVDQIVNCLCGGTYRKSLFSVHVGTKKHKVFGMEYVKKKSGEPMQLIKGEPDPSEEEPDPSEEVEEVHLSRKEVKADTMGNSLVALNAILNTISDTLKSIDATLTYQGKLKKNIEEETEEEEKEEEHKEEEYNILPIIGKEKLEQ